MKVICVTGTPGTGKTTLAKELAKKQGNKYLDANIVIKQNKLTETHDKKRKCWTINTKKLNSYLIKEINKAKKEKVKNLIIDSHLSHYLPKKYVNLCIVTKTNLKELEKRLKKRKYSKEKIKENLECEIFDICLNEAKQNRHKIKIIQMVNL